ncbi:MAG: hypothetical protein QNJ29_11165 [Rhizobiaceae bacterium]|nr:hypothetical protein [Rhizobiaceae bacterium]
MITFIVLTKISAIRAKVNETFGQMSLAMMTIPLYRHQPVADLNHMLLEQPQHKGNSFWKGFVICTSSKKR